MSTDPNFPHLTDSQRRAFIAIREECGEWISYLRSLLKKPQTDRGATLRAISKLSIAKATAEWQFPEIRLDPGHRGVAFSEEGDPVDSLQFMQGIATSTNAIRKQMKAALAPLLKVMPNLNPDNRSPL